MSLLFHDIIYGPVKSRRFGYSLGINLLPTQSKICSFNCIYCECGWNSEKQTEHFTPTNKILDELEKTLSFIKESSIPLDVLTYAGNGEPTLHNDFLTIANRVEYLRNIYVPNKKIVLLTNGTTLEKANIKKAINHIDLPVFKIDSAIEETLKKINLPQPSYSLKKYIEHLQNLNKPKIIQTMLLKGHIRGNNIDNTTENEIEKLIELYHKIQPLYVMLYSLDRKPPLSTLQKIETSQIETIAQKIEKAGINVRWV